MLRTCVVLFTYVMCSSGATTLLPYGVSTSSSGPIAPSSTVIEYVPSLVK